MQSGINLSLDQSPPPITFPALATPIFIFAFLLKKDSQYDLITSSALPLDALYGSSPPKISSSL